MPTKNSYYARLIKDIAVTFNHTPLTAQEIARYWKRSVADVTRVVNELYKEKVVQLNKRQEIKLTPDYKKFFNKNPTLALEVAAKGF